MNAEREVQRPFSFFEIFQTLLLLGAIFLAYRGLTWIPQRVEIGRADVVVRIEPIDLDAPSFRSLSLAGAWVLDSTHPAVGGFSALLVAGDQLVALTDQGRVAFIPKPGRGGRTARLVDLPDGPKPAYYYATRDTEALAPDPLGRGWWVAFEQQHELWLYDSGLSRATKRLELGKRRWSSNAGIEGLLAREGPELLLFIEGQPRLFRLRGARGVSGPIWGLEKAISDVALLPDGRIAAIERGWSGIGFTNRLILLEPRGAGFRVKARVSLPVGLLDNLEGMAAERLPGGRTRLWIISDDNFQRPLRTLLLALDLPQRQSAR